MGDTAEDRFTRLADALDREADEQRHEQGLQDTACGQRGEQGGRDDRRDEVDGAAGRVRLLGEFGTRTGVGRVEGQARAGSSRLPTPRPIASATVDMPTK